MEICCSASLGGEGTEAAGVDKSPTTSSATRTRGAGKVATNSSESSTAWTAASGPHFVSRARVLLVGIGADEQLAGDAKGCKHKGVP
jgi:hypothetical protein